MSETPTSPRKREPWVSYDREAESIVIFMPVFIVALCAVFALGFMLASN